MVMTDIRKRLHAVGKTQVWLILKLGERGIKVQTPEFSYILSGVLTTPKAEKVLRLCDEILKEVEADETS